MAEIKQETDQILCNDRIVVDVIVSTSTRENAATYLMACKSLQRFYPNAKKIVVVPDDEAAYFRQEVPAWVEVQRDGDLITDQVIDQIKVLCPNRYGWYIQQFVKIAVLFAEAQDNNTLMIWDGDTLQTREITHSKGGALLYATIDEYHTPYFEAIWNCLGIDKKVPESFISQYIVLRGAWLKALQMDLGNALWLNSLISSIDFNEVSGFSEYELLGTFVMDRYPNQFQKHRKIRLQRFGNSRLGGIDRANSFWRRLLVGLPHLVAFESWDPVERKLTGQLRMALGSSNLLRRIAHARWKIGQLLSTPLSRRAVLHREINQFLSWFFDLDGDLRIVQVGANDGIQNDFLYPFREVERPNTEHVLIEPHPYYVQLLTQKYQGRSDVTVVQAAIGDKDHVFDLHFISPAVADRMNGNGPANGWAHGQGSSSRVRVVKTIYENSFRGHDYRKQIPLFLDAISTLSVKCVPLADFEFVGRIICLVIDVQGMEVEVLSTLNEESLPQFVIIEDEFSDSRLLQKMLSLGYKLLIDGHDKVFEHRNSRFKCAN